MRIVAPSSPFESRLLWRAMGFLSQRYSVRYDRGIFRRRGYLAGADERRMDELQRALSEPGVAAIYCARGGYGLSRYAHRIDWGALRASPRWVCGFSDITAIHVEAQAVGVATLHSCNMTALGRGDTRTRDRVIQALEAPTTANEFVDLDVIAAGEAEGRLVGGNLTVLHACAAAGRLHLPARTVLLIEDVTEMPYRIDRMLTTLRVGGHLASVVAVVVGEFTRCAPGADGTSVWQVLRETLGGLGVPVVAGLPIGHGRNNEPVVLGAPVRVMAADRGSVSMFS